MLSRVSWALAVTQIRVVYNVTFPLTSADKPYPAGLDAISR